jgi:hypothetical protein
VFRNGALLATGTVFGIEGLVYGTELLWSPDPAIASHTAFLLQVCCKLPYDLLDFLLIYNTDLWWLLLDVVSLAALLWRLSSMVQIQSQLRIHLRI